MNAKEARRMGMDARAANRPRTACPSPLHDVTRTGLKFREAWRAGWDAMDAKLSESSK